MAEKLTTRLLSGLCRSLVSAANLGDRYSQV